MTPPSFRGARPSSKWTIVYFKNPSGFPYISEMANRPPRLTQIFGEHHHPLWFVTFNTYKRAALLNTSAVYDAFKTFCSRAAERGVCVGRFVLMPDHAHLFVMGCPDFKLGSWIRSMKLTLSKAIPKSSPHWQEGFFDHLVRRSESYSEKWNYVRENPVRAGLVASADDWPYQGEIERLPFD